MQRVHIVGAGISGLACAVRLASEGHDVILYEGAGHAGGRCRSFHDDHLDCTIDNGNHLLLSGNTGVQDYLALIDAEAELTGPDRAVFPFVDLAFNLKWTVEIDDGWWPGWILDRNRRIPGTGIWDYLKSARLMTASENDVIQDVIDTDTNLFRRFIEPLTVGVLNTPAESGSAALLAKVIRETFIRGARACRPRMAKHGLSQTFVEPALRYLEDRDARFEPNRRLKNISTEGQRAVALAFGDGKQTIDTGDMVVLALPAQAVGKLLPAIDPPSDFHPIVNAHFRVDDPPEVPEQAGLIGIVGGTAQWVFFRDNIISVTVSAADELAQQSNDSIADAIWRDLRVAISGLSKEPPHRHRVIKERRATFSQTPRSIRHRAQCRCGFDNIFLAGDWVDTGLPATIEGSIRSGFDAARMIATVNS